MLPIRSLTSAALAGLLCLGVAGRVAAQDQAPAPPPPDANSGGAYYPDQTCESGYATYLVTNGVRVCYTPDPVNENSNLQGTCPSDPSLFVCPDQQFGIEGAPTAAPRP